MQLPNRSKAYIPLQKLTTYLLSETHAIGKSKAKFFRALGFNETNVRLLEQEFLQIAVTADIIDTVSTPHGAKYILDGLLQTPVGSSVKVRTVWIIEMDEDSPRFVTAYPAG